MNHQFKIFRSILTAVIISGFFTHILCEDEIKKAVTADRISDIEFHKIYPFFSNELLDIMSIYAGSVFDSVKVFRQKEILREYYNGKGYDSVNVKINSERESKKLIKLDIKILKSKYYALDKINVKGNKYFSDFRLKKELKTYWRSWLPWDEPGRFIPDEFETDKKKIEDFYRERGFADIEIENSFKKDSADNTADITFNIEEGPLYYIKIKGNHFFSKMRLKRQIKLLYQGRRGEVAVRQIVRAIKERYTEQGFNDVKIEWKDSIKVFNHVPNKEVTILIKEGKRIGIKDIHINGNKTFKAKKLKPYMNSVVSRWWRWTDYFNKAFWEDDIRNLKAYYEQRGFLSPEISGRLKYNSDNSKVTINIDINEGVRTYVKTAEFSGSGEIVRKEEKRIRSSLEGAYFSYGKLKEHTDYLKGSMAAKGYIYSNVKNRVIFSEDSATANVKFEIDSGKIVSTGKIFIAGNLKTKPYNIKKQLLVKEDKKFSILDMAEGQRNLRDQKIFKSVNIKTPGIEDKKDTIDILIEVEEYPPYYIQSSGGYESFSGPFISFLAGNKNLFGRNKELSFSAEASSVKQAVSCELAEPAFFHRNLSASVAGYWAREFNFEPDFETRALGFGTGFNYKWENKLHSSALVQIENRELYQKTVLGEDSDTVRNIGRLRIMQSWDRRNSFLRPKKGLFTSFETEFSTGLNNNRDDFIKYMFDFKYFYSPTEFITLAFFTQYNYLQVSDQDFQPLVDQLFYLGGTGTVRGINEKMFLTDSEGNSVGGKVTALAVFESRLVFREKWEIPIFCDTGLLTKTVNGDKGRIRTTVGTGLRLITPIGAMGILYGFPTDIKDGLVNGVFHFSLGYTF